MKIEYTEAKLELVEFDIEDVLTTSVPEDEPGQNPGGADDSDEGYSGYH
jgi:hypothetical protein